MELQSQNDYFRAEFSQNRQQMDQIQEKLREMRQVFSLHIFNCIGLFIDKHFCWQIFSIYN